LEAGILVEAMRLSDLHEAFWAITLPRRFPNPALARVLSVD
jgi:LysR family transcriptional activator of nhaA